MYKALIRPLFFSIDPEKIHHISFKLIKGISTLGLWSVVRRQFVIKNKELERNVFGLKFPNPVGLAAGFDKDGKLFEELANFGFGFIEIGTVTPLAQKGNEKKRLFRLKKDSALINRMGFNNDGVDKAVDRLKTFREKNRNPNFLIGGNIGKNKITPNDQAVNDYIICFKSLYALVDYFVVNVSSPNTPNLRELQEKEPLKQLLQTLQDLNNSLAKSDGLRKPILLKIAPDLSNEQLLDIIEIISETKLDGIIATNTTLSREGLTSSNKKENGGLSGKPLTERSTEVIAFIAKHSKNSFPIIGVGGIHSAKDAIDKINAGAALVQLYTGFVYEGPQLIKDINKAILNT